MKGVDFDETFAPVARIELICLLMTFTYTLKFKLYQMDVKSAFLNKYLHEEVFVAQLEGFEDPLHPYNVYKLKKVLYGLKQVLRAWYERFMEYLLKVVTRKGEHIVLSSFKKLKRK